MNMPRTAPALLLLALALAGCNSDSPPATASNGNGSGSPAATTSLTVSPSLGLVRDADVRVLSLSGAVLAESPMDGSGNLDLEVSGLDRGFVVEVSGNANASFYDEGLMAWRALPVGSTLHAASADGRAAVAVTALTEIAYRRATQLVGGGTLTAAAITQANAELADWLARVPERIDGDGTHVLPAEAADILHPAQPVDDLTALSSGTAAGRYAILLATLAQQAYEGAAANGDPCLADVGCSPLLPLIAQLATDFADGVLDNKNPHGGSNGLPFIDPDVDPVDVLPPAPSTDLTPQEEIGREFPGTYMLTCSGDSEPTTMVIEGNGAMTLSGPHGTYSLPFEDVTRKAPLVEHVYRITPTGKAFTARLEHLEFGEPYYKVVVDLEINAHASGSVQLVKGNSTINCTTSFTHGELQPRVPYFTDILFGTTFICQQGGPGTLRTLTFGPTSFRQDGVLQSTQHGAISEYKHVMYKTAYPADRLHTYEYYNWGTSVAANFLSLSRGMLRYQGYPNLSTFDMQHAGNMSGLVNCSPEGPSWAMEVGTGSGIVLNFGDTQLTL
jgi:hypothetical protein